MQLADVDVQATVAVKNLEAAKKFYEETLGLKRDATSRRASCRTARRRDVDGLRVAVRGNEPGDGRDLGRARRTGAGW